MIYNSSMNGVEQATLEQIVLGLPSLGDLPKEEIGSLIQTLRLRHYPAGTVLFNEGDPADRLSILVMGEVEIVKSLGTEDERCLSSLKPVDIFGESSLLFPNRLRYASARTLSVVILLEMLHSDFEELLLRQPLLGYHVMKEMTICWSNAEKVIIAELKEKNLQLLEAYKDLKLAQDKLIESE